MHRAFISLYGLLVASVILVGWSLNYFWERFSPADTAPPETRALMLSMVAEYKQGRSLPSTLGDVQIDVLSRAELEGFDAGNAMEPDTLYMARTTGAWLWYQWVDRADEAVIVLRVPAQDERDSPLYALLVVVFYLTMAAVVLAWVWPLSRDSRRLEKQIAIEGTDGVPPPLVISPRSTFYPLASVFNQMSERVRALMASHRDMTNAVSHELRTPLARMKFALAMVEEKPLDTVSRRQITSITADVAEMEQLITSLLRYAGFQSTLSSIAQTEQPATLMADSLTTLVNRQYPSLGLTVDNRLGEAPLCCEWSLMSTVIANLVSNAAKYGATELHVTLATEQEAWLIAVEDNGPGIAPEDRERAFDAFVRLCHTSTSNSDASVSGFGVGLAVVKRILTWHHGNAACGAPSVLGGARIELRWPFITV